jgi:hypothetical protein
LVELERVDAGGRIVATTRVRLKRITAYGRVIVPARIILEHLRADSCVKAACWVVAASRAVGFQREIASGCVVRAIKIYR